MLRLLLFILGTFYDQRGKFLFGIYNCVFTFLDIFSFRSTVEITTFDVTSDETPSSPEDIIRIQVDYKSISKTVSVGSEIKLDDGLIALAVTNIDSDETIICTALNGGPIKKNKGVNLPGTTIDLPALTEKDKKDLKWACENQADFVAGI